MQVEYNFGVGFFRGRYVNDDLPGFFYVNLGSRCMFWRSPQADLAPEDILVSRIYRSFDGAKN